MPQTGMTISQTIRAVLFDLDGTLIDSAPDLAGAGDDMRIARDLAPLGLEHYRPMVGAGARGMVGRAFGIEPQDERFAALRDEFLDRYERRMTQQTCVFAAMLPVLAALESNGVPWGIVTNKATRFAAPLAAALELVPRACALVCGDTTAHAKPHPEPLLEAARRLETLPAKCVYVGDDLRDVQAGRAAGMATVVAGWGYLGLGEPLGTWGADHIAATPVDLLTLLQMT
jgi:N-acetyl-D-muramate 6-phosphate phosphatase